MRLNSLAPDVIGAIFAGRQPAELSANKLMKGTRYSLGWHSSALRSDLRRPETIKPDLHGQHTCIVEIMVLIGTYNMHARFVSGLDIILSHDRKGG